MGNKIVPALPFSHNDISSLAQTFKIAFNYFCDHSSPFVTEYLRELNTLVGLGFTAALVDGDSISVFDNDLKIFLTYRNFKAHPEAIESLSSAVANLLCWSTQLFRILNYPRYYEEFAQAVKKTISGTVSSLYGNPGESQRLLNMILQKE